MSGFTFLDTLQTIVPLFGKPILWILGIGHTRRLLSVIHLIALPTFFIGSAVFQLNNLLEKPNQETQSRIWTAETGLYLAPILFHLFLYFALRSNDETKRSLVDFLKESDPPSFKKFRIMVNALCIFEYTIPVICIPLMAIFNKVMRIINSLINNNWNKSFIRCNYNVDRN